MEELASIISKPLTSVEVQRVLSRFNLIDQMFEPLEEGMPAERFLTDKAGGIQIEIQPDGRIGTVFLHSFGKDGFGQFQYPLVGGLKFSSTPADVLKVLGQSIRKRHSRPAIIRRHFLGQVRDAIARDTFQLWSWRHHTRHHHAGRMAARTLRWRLTIHSSRSRFAARLNSGVRPHVRQSLLGAKIQSARRGTRCSSAAMGQILCSYRRLSVRYPRKHVRCGRHCFLHLLLPTRTYRSL